MSLPRMLECEVNAFKIHLIDYVVNWEGDEDIETTESPYTEGNIFSLVFGGSDTDDDSGGYEDEPQEPGAYQSDQWLKVDEVEGLWHLKQLLSAQQQRTVTAAIAAEGWFAQPQHNQAMRFGDLPGWALDLCGLISHRIRSYISAVTDLREDMTDDVGPLPRQILEREPLFDQMIANSYQPGEGIKAHVDLLRFEDGIAVVSLESTCVMSFTHVGDGAESSVETDTRKRGQHSVPVDGESQPCSSLSEPQGNVSFVRERNKNSGLATKVDVLLQPGDLLVSYGPARYLWAHEIDRSKDKQVWFGQTIDQSQRISLTFRRLCPQTDTV